jgi:dUTP pyrophosphatase
MLYTLKIKIHDSAPDFVKDHYNNFSNHFDGDSGIDLIVPYQIVITPQGDDVPCGTIDHLIQCEMINELNENVSYYLYPRSSISKTPLVMANSVGVIDAGYRGNIMAKVKNMNLTKEFIIKEGDKLFQICAPDLKQIQIEVITHLSETKRGTGGFGSTNAILPKVRSIEGFLEPIPVSPKKND